MKCFHKLKKRKKKKTNLEHLWVQGCVTWYLFTHWLEIKTVLCRYFHVKWIKAEWPVMEKYIIYTRELALLPMLSRLFFPLHWVVFKQSVWEIFPPASSPVTTACMGRPWWTHRLVSYFLPLDTPNQQSYERAANFPACGTPNISITCTLNLVCQTWKQSGMVTINSNKIPC